MKRRHSQVNQSKNKAKRVVSHHKNQQRFSTDLKPSGQVKKQVNSHSRYNKAAQEQGRYSKTEEMQLYRPQKFDPPLCTLGYDEPRIIARRSDWLILYKPAGWLTHSDGREGPEARADLINWAQKLLQVKLGVHQRLDVSTSGLIAVSLNSEGAKTVERSIKQARAKRYLAVVEGCLTHSRGEINQPVPKAPHREAKTIYQCLHQGKQWSLLELTPLTGRTHQLRAHCASLGTPIRGDGRYGNAYDLRAPRALLHAQYLVIAGEEFYAEPPADFTRYLPYASRQEYVQAVLNGKNCLYQSQKTTCYRLFNGAPEGFPGWRVDRYGDWQWIIHDQSSSPGPIPEIKSKGIYRLEALVDRSGGQQSAPRLWQGQEAPNPLHVFEAGVQYAVELGENLSTGLFLDQRPQRAWLAQSKKSWGRVLNTFAHAGGFSIAAALAGAETISVDLSAKWLNRIPHQLELNGINPEKHQCLVGDVFDWLRRLNKRGEKFDLIILDPPSTSVGTKKKRWSAAKDYPELVQLSLPLLSPGGYLLTCTNHRKLTPKKFVKLLGQALPKSQGYVLERVCAPGLDFPSDEVLGVKNLLWRAPF